MLRCEFGFEARADDQEALVAAGTMAERDTTAVASQDRSVKPVRRPRPILLLALKTTIVVLLSAATHVVGLNGVGGDPAWSGLVGGRRLVDRLEVVLGYVVSDLAA